MRSIPARNPQQPDWSSSFPQRRVRSRFRLGLVLWLFGSVTASTAWARDLYVDNLLGQENLNGSSAMPVGGPIGPTRSIRRALQYANGGDTIHIANRGVPYYETVTLQGALNSGFPGMPFRLVSDGAVISGARRVPPVAWIEQTPGLWKFTPDGKGWYLLLQGGQPLPEVPLNEADGLVGLPVGQWGSLRGSIFFRTSLDSVEGAPDQAFEFAYDQTGITLIDVKNVEIEGLVVRHFRYDGVHAHDRVERAFLQNMRLETNGRSGLAVSGTSSVGLTNVEIVGNRGAGVTLREHGWLETRGTRIDAGTKPLFDRSANTTLFLDDALIEASR
jgi:hypothetical protein